MRTHKHERELLEYGGRAMSANDTAYDDGYDNDPDITPCCERDELYVEIEKLRNRVIQLEGEVRFVRQLHEASNRTIEEQSRARQRAWSDFVRVKSLLRRIADGELASACAAEELKAQP